MVEKKDEEQLIFSHLVQTATGQPDSTMGHKSYWSRIESTPLYAMSKMNFYV